MNRWQVFCVGTVESEIKLRSWRVRSVLGGMEVKSVRTW